MREHRSVIPTGVERFIGHDEVIVSKTDTRGVITYANTVFCRVAGFSVSELVGAPHNIIRHPDMPRCVFKLLWDRIGAGNEVFAYVKNMARNGDHYWVLAHVTPTYGPNGEIISYHSNRRFPSQASVKQIEPVYAQLREIECVGSPKESIENSSRAIAELLDSAGVTYEEFIFSIIR